MKRLIIIICCILMFTTSCVIVSKKKEEKPIEYGNAFLINVLHKNLIEKYFPKDKNKIIRIYRNEKLEITSEHSVYDYSKYDVVMYQKEYSYSFKVTYEIEIKEDVIISCKQKDIIFLGIEESESLN